ncbi:UNVERIFIED_CONTAM: hypothetical protein Slati_3951200 [Sesamum latifolium]|uniref:DUF4283 domain-containing protein n=1 Tax=Sesamum latifolium TaxID=2727402 RepID=A0AAW2TPF8_9LAMI
MADPHPNEPPDTNPPPPPKTPAVPPPKKSYANIVQNSSNAHFDPSRAVKKSFQNSEIKTMGTATSFRGEPGIRFSKEETDLLAERLKFALIGKFSHGLPSLNFLKNRLIKLDLRGSVSVGAINLKHVLIQLSHEEDYSRLWLRGEWLFDNYPMRVFKWSPKFNPHIESPIAPVWIKFPELPCHLFEKNALFGIASLIGKPLRMDEPTADLSRPSMARVCVELDLTASRTPAIFLEVDDLTIRQSVIYENCPLYCSHCKHLGHDQTTCLNKSKGEQAKGTLLAKTT